MVEENGTNNNSENADNGQENVALRDLRGVLIAAASALIFLALVAKFWPNLPQRMAFFTDNLFNLIIAFAVIAQVVIYRKQWRIMEKQIKLMKMSERAYVVVDAFQPPKFGEDFITVEGKLFNRGRTPAFNLRRNFQIAIGKGTPPEDWGRFDWDSSPDTSEGILIPANSDINFGKKLSKVRKDDISKVLAGELLVVVDGSVATWITWARSKSTPSVSLLRQTRLAL